VEVRILVEKWNIYEAYILSISLVHICRFRNDSFLFMYLVSCKHIQCQPMSMYTCLFLIVISKETLVLMCLASHFDIIEGSKMFIGHRDTNNKENIKIILICGG